MRNNRLFFCLFSFTRPPQLSLFVQLRFLFFSTLCFAPVLWIPSPEPPRITIAGAAAPPAPARPSRPPRRPTLLPPHRAALPIDHSRVRPAAPHGRHLVTAPTRAGDAGRAVAVFRCMLAEDVVPNEVTLAGVVTAFVRHGAPTTVAIMAHGVVLRRGWMSLSL